MRFPYLALALSTHLSAQETLDPGSSAPVVVAAPVLGNIRIDGRLDEAAWASATPVSHFIQRDPDPGAPASERTEVRVLFDDAAVYVGARLFDSTAQVESRLARRDSWLPGSDWFSVAFDSYHDHLTAFRFSLNPDGVRRDEKISPGNDHDGSWDPVWTGSATRDATGWTAEMRIPLSQLRFRREATQVWGIQFVREIARNAEQSWFAYVPKSERAVVARYGHLVGLSGLAPQGRLELLPYVVARARYDTPAASDEVSFSNPYRDGSEQRVSLGGDLKYRLASNLTLDATINPDFGQVEADPAVVNLSAFETRFEERRPFFNEGSEIFRFNGSELFYSRRIGARPPGDVPDEAVYTDMPDQSTILAAAKLTGKAHGWSLALLDAVTDREHASYVDADGARGLAPVAPRSNYFVGRARREMRAGQTVVGGMITTANRDLADSALAASVRSRAIAGGADFTHEWNERKWLLEGFLAGSRIDGSSTVITSAQESSARYFQRPDATHLTLDSSATSLEGFAGRLRLRRQAGEHWRGDAMLGTVSPGFETNDVGFQSRADQHSAIATVQYVHEQPGRRLREWRLEGGPRASWNYDGDRIGTRLNFEGRAELLNYWNGDFEINHELSSLDDRLTRGGPLVRSPARSNFQLRIESDDRKAVTVDAEFDTWWGRAGSRTSYELGLGFKPAPNWSISVGPEWSRERARSQYVTSVIDSLASSTFGVRYVFADLDQTELSVATRVNVTFTPTLSLEAYARPFFGSGTFAGLKELVRPRAYDFTRYAGGSANGEDGEIVVDPDGAGPADAFVVDDETFTTRSLRGDAVLRWEWRPGSALFLVWQQQRELEDASGDLRLRRDLRRLGRARPDNVFVLKATWWINP